MEREEDDAREAATSADRGAGGTNAGARAASPTQPLLRVERVFELSTRTRFPQPSEGEEVGGLQPPVDPTRWRRRATRS
jgi:hypothetical protein